MYLSATAIKDYLACPQRLQYRINGAPKEETVYMLRGTAVHNVIEDRSINDAEEAKTAFLIKFSELLYDKNVKFPFRVTFGSMTKQANTMLDYYYNYVNVHEPPIRESEIPFSIVIKDIEFTGRIDQIRGNSIYDWKTKTKPIDSVTLNADYQFTMYGMAYKELYGEYPENIYYGHLYDGILHKVERTRKDYKYLEDVASKIIFAAENDVFPRNYGEYTCGYCVYKNQCFNDKGQVIY